MQAHTLKKAQVVSSFSPELRVLEEEEETATTTTKKKNNKKTSGGK